MPSSNYGPVVSTNSGALLTLSYERIEVVGTTAYLVNPTVQFFSKSGWSDNNNKIFVTGSAVRAGDSGQVHSSPENGAINGGTRSWGVESRAIGLSYDNTTYATFAVRIQNLSMMTGDARTQTWEWSIEFPQLSRPPASTPLTPNPPGPLQAFGSLRDKDLLVVCPGTRRDGRIWLPSNGKRILLYVRGSRTLEYLFLQNPGSRRRQILTSGSYTDTGELLSMNLALNATLYQRFVINEAGRDMVFSVGFIATTVQNSGGDIEFRFTFED